MIFYKQTLNSLPYPRTLNLKLPKDFMKLLLKLKSSRSFFLTYSFFTIKHIIATVNLLKESISKYSTDNIKEIAKGRCMLDTTTQSLHNQLSLYRI